MTPETTSRVRPALVHDYLLVMRGAERTFAEIAACWEDAPIHTLLYDRDATRGRFDGRVIATSPLQHLRLSQRSFRSMLPLFPLAASRLTVGGRLVVSSSSAFAHGVSASDAEVHVCYCHSPFRYVWHDRGTAIAEAPRLLRPVLPPMLDAIRRWDIASSRRVTHYIANSEITRQRIGDFWGRDSVVVHPPVGVHRFRRAEPEGWFLTVSEVVRHKRIHVALEAARRAERSIKVVGTGPDLERLRREYAGTAEFLGRVDDGELESLYARARALVVPNVEEFGIAAVEAQAAGRPVLAVDAGGARETVMEGVTGHRVPVNDVKALSDAMGDADLDALDPKHIVANARRFSPEAFRKQLTAVVDDALGQSSGARDGGAGHGPGA